MLLSFIHLVSFADSPGQKEKKSQSLKDMMHSAGITPTNMVISGMYGVYEHGDLRHTLPTINQQMKDLNALYANAASTGLELLQDQIDTKFDAFSSTLLVIPRAGIKGISGTLGSQMLSKNVYKQIVCKHIIYSLVDTASCPNNKNFGYCIPEQLLRGATVEATSWALTEYIFKQMEKKGYDPFALPPYKQGTSELLYVLNPTLKDLSKMVVNAVLASYVVAPGYDKAVSVATGRVEDEIKLTIFSLNFGDI